MVMGIDDMIMLGLGGGSLLSGILGQNKQAKLAKEQMAQQKALTDRQLAMAEQDARLARASQTDQYGNQLSYDPVTNSWKTQLSAQGQQISDAERQELLRTLQYDAPMARGEAIAAAGRRTEEGQVANSLMQQLKDHIGGGYKGNELASSLRLARTQAMNAGFSEAKRAFNTNALRTGMSAGAAGDALAEAGKSWGNYATQAMGNPELEGLNAAEELNSAKRGSLVDAYSAMASRATGSPGYQYTPSGQSSALSQSLAGARSGAISGTAAAGGMIGNAATTDLNAWKNLTGAMNPNYQGAFNQAANLYSGYGSDLVSTLAGAYKNRSSGGNNKSITYGGTPDSGSSFRV